MVPMMLPGVLSGAIMSWVTVISELSSSIMLYRASTQTLTVSIYTEVIRDCFGNAAAYSTVLTVTSVLSLLLFFKLTAERTFPSETKIPADCQRSHFERSKVASCNR